ncbi:helix-turn-helix transcriptional regulator [Paenibacillus tritici]|uniref:Helix-turn-helix transcriptional regulator n=1 Tax=Paenibacillus tritici TaxID=1873425 RepID=A0ABX2DWV8_9BACL|nr:LuxR C-terminal-related transcriptional regulator [Paenibacillus tritici]NQX49212.1 helix-turn-helix transcriptional regulator [Paenibacillus tritici]
MNKMMRSIQQLDPARGGPFLNSQQYREAVIAALRFSIPFAAACCTTVDPHTLLTTGAVTEQGLEAVHSVLFEYEYLHEDYMKYETLAAAAIPVASLSLITGGQPQKSERYRKVLQPAGFGDELRAALRAGGVCWGFLTLFRPLDHPPFQEQECAVIASVVPLIAERLRGYASVFPASGADRGEPEDNGILVLSDRLVPQSANAAAHYWLKQIWGLEHLEDRTLPGPVRAVCLRVLAESHPSGTAPSAARICLQTGDGAYLTLTASLLGGPQRLLAVSLVSARSADVFRLLADAFALTEREKQLAGMLALGLSTKELAESLHISAYTVQDHLKSIFVKTGVSSRRELISRLLSR